MSVARFTERVVLLTGAASGIGAAAARRLAEEGASLVLVDRDGDGLDRLQLPGADPLTIVADTSDPEAVDDAVGAALERFGRIDALVANAGIWQERSFLDLTLAEWDRVISVNLRGTFLVCQRVARAMVDAGRPGAIVATTSTNATVAEHDTAHYNAAKGGVHMLVRSMATDLGPYGIRVNAIAPGTIETPLNQAALDGMPDGFRTASLPPLLRWGRAEECAAAIAFLASDDASFVNGTTLLVDGGRLGLNGPPKETP